MALLDAYLTPAEYEARATKGRVIDESYADDLLGASRLVDHRYGLAPGSFNTDPGTRWFSGRGQVVLRLEESSTQHLVHAVTGITVDGVSFTLTDGVIPLPRNAAVLAKSWDSLLLSFAAPLEVWPRGDFNVGVSGSWGHAAVPEGVKTVVYNIVRDVRDHQAAGAAAQYQMGAEALPLASDTWRRIKELDRQFSYRSPVRVVR